MAELSGHTGKVDIAGTVVDIKSWTCDYVGEALETTDFGDSGHRTYIAGLDGWGGSFEGSFAQEAMEVMGTIASLKLYVSTSKYISGAAVLTGIHLGTPVDGIVTVSYDFQGNGELTLTNLV